MVKRNSHLAKLPGGYLFPEINRRRKAVAAANPDVRIISLGIGNTTEPLTPHVTEGLTAAARGMGTPEGYSGYGDEQGMTELRAKIAENLYRGIVAADEVLTSDGAKCDIGRLQLMFGSAATVAVQATDSFSAGLGGVQPSVTTKSGQPSGFSPQVSGQASSSSGTQSPSRSPGPVSSLT